MNKLLEMLSKYKLITVISILLFSIYISVNLYNWYKDKTSYHIFVKFVKSGPLFTKMPVCFKGYEIGLTQTVTLSDDYKYTLVKIVLFPKNPKLPKDIDAVVKKHDFLGNYIDLIPSDEASNELLKDGDTIDGTPLFDLGTFMAEIADSKLLIPLIQNFSDTAVSLNKTSGKIGDFFSDSRSVLKDNKQNINESTKNFAKSSKSLTKITSNINTSFNKDKLDSTSTSMNKSVTNIQAATENIKNITQSVDCATRNLDKTMGKIDGTISETKDVATNVKVITCGIRETMSKKFAGLRIIFGKPLNKNKCVRNCAK